MLRALAILGSAPVPEHPMKSASFVLVCGFLACTAATAADLDLSLPDNSRFGKPYVPPGSPPDDGDIAASADDGSAQVHGSITTGIGYTEGLGSSTFNRVHLNASKTFGDEHPMRVGVDLDVSNVRGPAGRYAPRDGYGYGYGPRGFADDWP